MKTKKGMLWLILGIAAVVAAAVVGVCLLVGAQSRPELYWNLDAHLYNVNTNPRIADEDGAWQLRFAYEDEVKTFRTKKAELIKQIDNMRAVQLEFDKEGYITNAVEADTVLTEICDGSYVKSMTGETIYVNGSLAMNGKDAQITLGKKARIFDVSTGEVVVRQASELKPMDGVSAYADEKGRVTHIYVVSHPVESLIYWRVSRSYSSTKKETTRTPDENGLYSIDFYCEGEIVTLQCKDKELVTAIDLETAANSHFGFTFDEDGHISGILKSALGIRGLLACESYDITEMGETVTATELLNNKGLTWTGTVHPECRVFDISDVAYAEGHMGQQVEGMQLGDRVTVWTDTEGRAIRVYVLSRLVDCPSFFNVSRKYDSKTKETTRKPNEDGWYEVSLLKEGDTEAQVYKTQDKALMSYLDSYSSRCVGVVADENNVLQQVYHATCLFGEAAWTSGGVVHNTAGSIVIRINYGNTKTTYNGIMMPDCKIYNVSTTGEYGKETTLRVGDYIYAFRQPSGELVRIYVTRRCNGAQTMYYNLGRSYDEKTGKTTRQPDGEGWYSFVMAHEGEKVTLKTNSEEMATAIDAYTPGAVSLKVTDGIIEEVNAPNYACGGSTVAGGNTYQSTDAKGRLVTVDAAGKETLVTLGADCVIYDTHSGGKAVDAIREGDTVTVYTDRAGAASIIYIH